MANDKDGPATTLGRDTEIACGAPAALLASAITLEAPQRPRASPDR